MLGVERIGAHDDFFEIGGESLAAVRMLAALEELVLVQVGFSEFLDDPTVAGVAAAVQAARQVAAPKAEPPPAAVAAASHAGAPCTFAQERLWFVDRLDGATGAYNEVRGVRVRGALNAPALEQSLRDVADRHAALRTTFAAPEGMPVQVVAPQSELALTHIDLRSEPDPEAALELCAQELATEPFDLERGPLARAQLLRLGEQDHVLQLVIHHAVSDGWSHVVLLRELGALYAGRTTGTEATLPPPRTQYPDYAKRQRAELTGTALDEAVGPWVERLAGAPGELGLRGDRPRPSRPSYRGATHILAVPAADAAAARAFARETRTTPFATMLAAYYLLLQRRSGQHDIVVGATTSGRSSPELEDTIGLFASTVALRCDLADGPTFRELVGRVRDVVMWAIGHERAPFDQVVARLGLARDLSRHPVFQAFCAHVAEVPMPLPNAEPYQARVSASRFDLTLFVEEQPDDGLRLAWEYSTDLFDAPTIEGFAAEYVALLGAGLAEPDVPITQLMPAVTDVAQPPEAGASAEYPVACMHERFEAHARETPHAVALSFGSESMTYGELGRAANRLAHHLRALGVGPETRVALFVEPSIELVVAVLGVLKSGAAYVPIDPEYPAERIEFVLEDSAAQVLVTVDSLRARLPEHGACVVSIDGDRAALEAASDNDPEPLARPENLAYVIYTSGSTGRPKGVQVEHRQIARLFTATDAWYGFGPSDVWVLLHSYAFDFSVWELWGALAYGGRLVISPLWTTRSPSALAELIADEGVTVMNATPSLFVVVQDELLRLADQLSLRYVVFGGEALAPAALRPWFAHFGDAGARLVNMYGITETTVHVTYRPISVADCARETSPIGAPIPDLTLFLLDPSGAPVPDGVAGELYVGGAGVARGYLNRPELTSERFIPNPFGPGRLYRTGDVARRLPGGELEFRGRIDDQVKIRGFRIELGEIQSVLRDAPGVADCAVIAAEATPGDLRLAAYVVPDEETAGPARRVARLLDQGAVRPEQLLELPDGTAIAHLNRAEAEFSYGEIFERGSCLEDGIQLPAGACVFDVGANIGMFAMLVGRRSPGARIFAFEPIPAVNEALCLNAAIHSLDAVTFDCALGAQRGEATFTYFPHITIISGRDVDVRAGEAVLQQVVSADRDGVGREVDTVAELVHDRLEHVRIERPVRTVSDVIREYDVQHIDLLKIDVEGGELDVLAGVEPHDWDRIGQVFVEVHGGPERLRRVREMLAGAGFSLSVEQDDALLQVSERYDVVAVREPVLTAATPSAPEWRGPQALHDAVRAHLEQRLPEYMVPASIVFMDGLPLTRNGKTDRKALPAPVWEAHAATEVAAPATATEREVAEVWTSVLGIDHVGREDDFFTLGGHSLLAARVATQVRERLSGHISVRALFEQPTLAGFAAHIDSLRRAKSDGEASTPESGVEPDVSDPGEVAPASFQQASLLFFEALDPGSTIYNAPMAIRVAGELDTAALRSALTGLLERHEALRTVFPPDAEPPRQLVLSSYTLDLEEIDLSRVAAGEREAELQRRLREHARRGFDLEHDVMLRASVFRLGPLGHVILLASHHIVLDAWAAEVMLRDLGELYKAARRRRAPELPPLAMQYRDFARWQRERLTGEYLEGELAFWRSHLAGAPATLHLPTDHPRPKEPTFDGDTVRVKFGADLARALRAVAQDARVTPYMLLMGAFATLLYRRSGDDDIVLGGPVANREHAGLEHLVGFCANTSVTRVRLEGNPRFSELLSRVRESVLASYEHQEIPLEMLVDAVRPERVPGTNPLFQVNFRVRVGAPTLPLPGARTSFVPVDLGHARFELALELHLEEDGVVAEWSYNIALYEAATVQGLADDFGALLEQVLADPERRLLELAVDGAAGAAEAALPQRAGPVRRRQRA